jgi:hypothetical protein
MRAFVSLTRARVTRMRARVGLTRRRVSGMRAFIGEIHVCVGKNHVPVGVTRAGIGAGHVRVCEDRTAIEPTCANARWSGGRIQRCPRAVSRTRTEASRIAARFHETRVHILELQRRDVGRGAELRATERHSPRLPAPATLSRWRPHSPRVAVSCSSPRTPADAMPVLQSASRAGSRRRGDPRSMRAMRR